MKKLNVETIITPDGYPLHVQRGKARESDVTEYQIAASLDDAYDIAGLDTLTLL